MHLVQIHTFGRTFGYIWKVATEHDTMHDLNFESYYMTMESVLKLRSLTKITRVETM